MQFSPASKVLIIGQAPGSRVHASGIAWDDASGDRLRDWLGMDKTQFYDASQVALVPMGFCYPGKAKGGDKPPRRECAPQWHRRVIDQLPVNRLTLLVGTYAQQHYLPQTKTGTMRARVESFASFLPEYFPLPHPAWRSTIFMRDNPWFEREVLPALRREVQARLS